MVIMAVDELSQATSAILYVTKVSKISLYINASKNDVKILLFESLQTWTAT
jgi:hypothetical protein